MREARLAIISSGPADKTMALASDRPVILEAYVDPNVSMLPPQISLEEAKNFTSALVKGDPNERGVIKESIKSVLSGVFPHADK